ncbi:MAG: hypothetical protein BGO49_17280 [Planctomycetales bacterium 71-10]|nr:MAG: hypothetical protein BGO49_17280 [Planctomycetales bacterium 71-10]
MAWPTPQEYNEAVQSPQVCFSDPELKRGSPALTPLGLPRPISGAFASVYRIDCQGRSWAVRCFLREYADQQHRYSAISERLRGANLPCMVGFEFLARGILVGGRWHPILKMEWLDGISLNEYVGQNVNRPDVLRSLSRRWIDLMRSLKDAGIAHGDLQHGNVLVRAGELKLIDYDAMYVPALSGLQSHEEGHRNYQHTERTGKDFHADLDNFSAWVIFTSISALAIDPRLWKLPNAGDECLLFRREDFENPRNSKVLLTLEKHGNLQLKTLVSHFRSLLTLPLAQVPSLDDSILDAKAGTQPGGLGTTGVGTQGLPNWIADHIDRSARQPQPEPHESVREVAPIGGAAWLYDHLIDEGTANRPHVPVVHVRYSLTAWSVIILIGLLWAGWLIAWVPGVILLASTPFCVAVGTAMLLHGYRAVNPTQERETALGRIADGRARISQVERLIGLSKAERTRLGEPLAALKRAYDDLPQKMDAESVQLDRSLATVLGAIDVRRRNSQVEYDNEIRGIDDEFERVGRDLETAVRDIESRKLQADFERDEALRELHQRSQSAIARFERRKSELASDERAEIDRLLQQARSLHIKVALAQTKVTASVVPGIGEALAGRLRSAGISCAADVTYDGVFGVPGIGEAKANALVAWRQWVERGAILSSPPSLAPGEVGRIKDKYARLIQEAEGKIASVRQEERTERQAIDQRHAASKASLEAGGHSAKRDQAAKLQQARSRQEAGRMKAASALADRRRRLDAEEQVERRAHELRRDALKSKFQREKEKLAEEYQAEKGRVVEARKRLDQQFDEWNRSLFRLRLEARQDELALERLKIIGPWRYLRLVLIPKDLPLPASAARRE